MDRYEISTQLQPVISAIAPLTVWVLVCIRVKDFEDLVRSIVFVVGTAGLHVVAMRLVRDRGNVIQEKLWNEWGGQPTAQRLRWSGQDQNRVRIIHRRVQNMTGVQLPTEADELKDPSAAEVVYEDAVAQMRELTRERERYPRIFAELVQYSAARNRYGLKLLGASVSIVAILAAILAGSLIVFGVTGWLWWPILTAGGFAILCAVSWIFVITPEHVKVAADRYADALLSSASQPASGS